MSFVSPAVRVPDNAERAQLTLPLVPASFFGMVLGVGGLGLAWRAAFRAGIAPAIAGEIILAFAALLWATLLILFILKWGLAREHAVREARHPIQCCFIGLTGVSTVLMAIVALPYWADAARFLFAVGSLFTFAFAIWRTGDLWRGNRDHEATTPVLYLPGVAGGFVIATAAALLGYPGLSQLAFGMATFIWIGLESVVIHRLYTAVELPPPLRPLLGVQLAPPAVGAVAYLTLTGIYGDLFAHALIGYALTQAMLLVRLLPWIARQPFAPSYWAFSFGITALAAGPLQIAAHPQAHTGLLAALAPYLFVIANVVIAILALGTARLLLKGALIQEKAAIPIRFPLRNTLTAKQHAMEQG
jgi:tellurite resistance protein